MTMLGKSNMWTSSGSSMPFLVTMICFGCSSTGIERISAATCAVEFNNKKHRKNTSKGNPQEKPSYTRHATTHTANETNIDRGKSLTACHPETRTINNH